MGKQQRNDANRRVRKQMIIRRFAKGTNPFLRITVPADLQRRGNGYDKSP